MNASSMDDTESGYQSSSSTGGRVPSGAQAAALRSQVAAVLRVLHAARDDAAGHPAFGRARLLEKHGPLVEAGMLALGDRLADFLDESDEPPNLRALRSDFLEPIIALSRSLPIYSRAEEWQRNRHKTVELHELVIAGRIIGFDAETLLLDNFYENTIYSHALRTRIAALARLIREEAIRRLEVDRHDLRVLVLGANSVVNLASLFDHAETSPFSVVIVDGDSQTLRLARQHLEDRLGVRAQVFRLKPEALERGLGRVGSAFDMVFTLMLYDMHTPQSARGVTQAAAGLLKPGGVLLTGCFLPTVPKGYRAIARVFVEIIWQYWDEDAWRELLTPLPFDLANSRFEVLEPATIAVLARRK